MGFGTINQTSFVYGEQESVKSTDFNSAKRRRKQKSRHPHIRYQEQIKERYADSQSKERLR
jgi:hypothetical protein